MNKSKRKLWEDREEGEEPRMAEGTKEPKPRATTVWGRYKALHPRSRILLGLVGVAFSIGGILITDPSRPAAKRREGRV